MLSILGYRLTEARRPHRGMTGMIPAPRTRARTAAQPPPVLYTRSTLHDGEMQSAPASQAPPASHSRTTAARAVYARRTRAAPPRPSWPRRPSVISPAPPPRASGPERPSRGRRCRCGAARRAGAAPCRAARRRGRNAERPSPRDVCRHGGLRRDGRDHSRQRRLRGKVLSPLLGGF